MYFELKVDLCYKSNIEYRFRFIGFLDFCFIVCYMRCNLLILLKLFDLILCIC